MFPGLVLNNYCTHFLRTVLVLSGILVALSGSLSCAMDPAGTSALQLQTTKEHFVPSEYGKIVYQKNGRCAQQIFIIGQSHRSAFTGQSGSDTVRVQAEIYRIGEWLIREQNVELLLPEGFFQKTPQLNSAPADVLRKRSSYDNLTLKVELSDTSRFINADLLLNASYNIRLGQIEDEQLYRDIGRLLRKARRENSLSLLAELDGLQGERTATLLQNIPDAVEEAFRSGRIENHKAMFTVGLAHVNEIINILQRGTLPAPDQTQGNAGGDGLKLLDQGYGVTVIIPRTLAENKQILCLCKLDREAAETSSLVPEAQLQVTAER